MIYHHIWTVWMWLFSPARNILTWAAVSMLAPLALVVTVLFSLTFMSTYWDAFFSTVTASRNAVTWILWLVSVCGLLSFFFFFSPALFRRMEKHSLLLRSKSIPKFAFSVLPFSCTVSHTTKDMIKMLQSNDSCA